MLSFKVKALQLHSGDGAYLLSEKFALRCSLLQLCKNLRNLGVNRLRMGDVQEMVGLMSVYFIYAQGSGSDYGSASSTGEYLDET